MMSILLSIFHASPKTYRILSKLFILPTPETLVESLQKHNVYPGISPKIIAALKSKVRAMKPEDRQCLIVFDAMGVKKSLSYDAK